MVLIPNGCFVQRRLASAGRLPAWACARQRTGWYSTSSEMCLSIIRKNPYAPTVLVLFVSPTPHPPYFETLDMLTLYLSCPRFPLTEVIVAVKAQTGVVSSPLATKHSRNSLWTSGTFWSSPRKAHQLHHSTVWQHRPWEMSNISFQYLFQVFFDDWSPKTTKRTA